MQTVFIRFVSEEDRARGFTILSRQGRISSLPGQVYEVPADGLQLLESAHIKYRRATDAEVKAANPHVHDPHAPVL